MDELDDRFRLLTGGSRAGLARHRTLLASVEWSYELLDPHERVLLRRLGVFAGGWTVEAARQVAGFAPLDPAAVLDLLGRLVDKSLAQLDDSGRYWLLETIRAYARARAAEAGETAMVAGHHLAWSAVSRNDWKRTSSAPPRSAWTWSSANCPISVPHSIMRPTRLTRTTTAFA